MPIPRLLLLLLLVSMMVLLPVMLWLPPSLLLLRLLWFIPLLLRPLPPLPARRAGLPPSTGGGAGCDACGSVAFARRPGAASGGPASAGWPRDPIPFQ